MVIPNTQADAILSRVKFFSLATVSDNGQPWNVTIAPFHFPGEHVYYWISWQDNQHSKNIRANGKAFVAVYDSTPGEGEQSEGVYMLVAAEEVLDANEVAKVTQAIGGDLLVPTGQLLGDDPRRLYKIVPQRIWMSGDKYIDGKHVDVRIEAEKK